ELRPAFEHEAFRNVEMAIVDPVERRLFLLAGRRERALDLAEGSACNARDILGAGALEFLPPVLAGRRRRGERPLAGAKEVILVEDRGRREGALRGVLVHPWGDVGAVDPRGGAQAVGQGRLRSDDAVMAGPAPAMPLPGSVRGRSPWPNPRR